ncbi:MAG: DUF1501 domain-containing protein [Acidobacteriota bacterium]
MCTDITRRGFLVGCSAAIAGLAGSRFNTVAFGDPGLNQEILVVLFLRGGIDGLSLVPPIGGSDRGHYEAARPTLRIPTAGGGAAINLNGQFGLHPSASPLFDLFQDGNLAIVQATGISNLVNRSHFDAMQYVELGTPGSTTISTGWLTRHLTSAGNLPPDLVMQSLAVGDLQPASLLSNLETVNVANPDAFNVDNGPWLWRHAQRTALRALYQEGGTWLHDAGLQALDAVDIVSLNAGDSYTPANGAVYPDGDFGDQLKVLAQMIKLDLGLQVATLDFGGWDTHDDQGTGSTGYLADLFDELSRGLAAFYTDLDGAGTSDYMQRLTMVVQSEFGRELFENADSGTEHGYGNLMLLLGDNVNGGFHGTWPGLAGGQLVDGTDLAVTTDYRRVLSEVLVRRMCNPNISQIFPTYSGYSPMGVVQGEDLDTGGTIFADGFESGTTAEWSARVD